MRRRLRLFARWLRYPFREIEIVYVHSDVKKYCSAVLGDLLKSAIKSNENFDQHFLRIRLVNFLCCAFNDKPTEKFRFRTLRAATAVECQGSHTMPDAQENPLEFYFIETYGFRIALLLNIPTMQASIYHIERAQKFCPGNEAIEAVIQKHTAVVRKTVVTSNSLQSQRGQQK